VEEIEQEFVLQRLWLYEYKGRPPGGGALLTILSICVSVVFITKMLDSCSRLDVGQYSNVGQCWITVDLHLKN